MKIEIETRDENLVGTVHEGRGRLTVYTDDGRVLATRALTPEELLAEQRHRELAHLLNILVVEVQNVGVDIRNL